MTGKSEVAPGAEVEELRRSNRELEQFADFAAHDLKAPLRHIGNYLELLEDRLGALLDEETRDWIRSTCDIADGMKGLIDRLLEMARLGAVAPTKQNFDLGALVRDVVGLFSWQERPAGELRFCRKFRLCVWGSAY